MFLTFVGFSSNQFHGYLFELKGFGGMDIGILLMSGAAASVLGPLLQLYAIRHLRGPHLPLLITCLLAWVSLTLLPHMQGFWALWCFHILASFSFSSLYPLLTATTFEATREHGHSAFIRIRGIGTAGFFLGCTISLIFPRPAQLPLLYAGFGASFLIAGLAVTPALFRSIGSKGSRRPGINIKNDTNITKRNTVTSHPKAPGLRHAFKLLTRRDTLFLLVLIAILGYANTMATSMQGNYLVNRWHLNQRSISMAWMVSTGFEIPWMMLCAWVMHRISLRHAITLGFIGTSLKLCLLALAGLPAVYGLGLAFHGCFFSFVQIGMGLHLDRHYAHAERPSLQALSAALTQAIPAALAGLSAGAIWHYSNLHAVYVFSATLSLGVLALALLGLWPPRGAAENKPAWPT